MKIMTNFTVNMAPLTTMKGGASVLFIHKERLLDGTFLTYKKSRVRHFLLHPTALKGVSAMFGLEVTFLDGGAILFLTLKTTKKWMGGSERVHAHISSHIYVYWVFFTLHPPFPRLNVQTSVTFLNFSAINGS
jgi:hypothetical protein